MQFTKIALFAAAATAVSAVSNGTIVYTTDIVTAYTTYCPAATAITLGSSTYTVTEATTLTITDCPCTVVKPVTTSAIVQCSTCNAVPTSAPIFANSTAAAASTPAGTAVGTGAVSTHAGATASPSPIAASTGNKAATLSGAALAGLLGLAAYVL